MTEANQNARKHGAYSKHQPADPIELIAALEQAAQAALTRHDTHAMHRIARAIKPHDADRAELMRNIARRLEQEPAIRHGLKPPVRRFTLPIWEIDSAIDHLRQQAAIA